MFEMLASAFVVGFIVAVPPGAVTFVAAQKSILFGFKNGLIFTAGSSLSDIFYILLVFFGIAPLFGHSPLFKIIFWYASSILLFYFGFNAFRAIKHIDFSSDAAATQESVIQNFLSGVLITLANPWTIAGWIVVAGGFFTHWKGQWPPISQYGLVSIISMMAGVLCWFIPLIFVISKARSFLNHRVIKGFVLLSGTFFFGLGIFSFFSATRLLLN